MRMKQTWNKNAYSENGVNYREICTRKKYNKGNISKEKTKHAKKGMDLTTYNIISQLETRKFYTGELIKEDIGEIKFKKNK